VAPKPWFIHTLGRAVVYLLDPALTVTVFGATGRGFSALRVDFAHPEADLVSNVASSFCAVINVALAIVDCELSGWALLWTFLITAGFSHRARIMSK
jgi:hypothetical protein